MAVIDANDINFEKLLKTNDKVVVKYFAGWCGSCRLFKPKYKRLANDERFEGIAFLDIDAEESPNARALAGVNNLPFFAIFKDGKLVEGGPMSKEDAVVELIEKLK
ncbi:thioredoxin [Flammeovirga pectinis]|uniref:Thioredoxin n=1 Tax=Flammeovirga pectinis TaxID=2494373 RepID=A0A3S9NZE3_9BACT|nr:thioredoxin family protein [Flammeovirga pectinis]AZQ61294.1 thioredoxin [Flammeovirga pectinis]